MIAEAESTCLRDKSPSIMDGNLADWKASIASHPGITLISRRPSFYPRSSVILPHPSTRVASILLTIEGLSSHVGVLLTLRQYSYSSSNYGFAGGAPATTITAQRGLQQGDVEVEIEEDQRGPEFVC